MIRSSILAAVAVAALSSTAFAQGAASHDPAPLDRSAAADTVPGPNAGDRGDDGDAPPPPPPRSAASERDRDLFCRRDAARRTGYTTPGQAASDEQARGTIGGTLGGAALGAIIGGASGNAGAGAAIGAGAGLVAGSAIGADNARRAASDVQRAYGDAYYACMDEAQDADDAPPRPDDRYAADYPPPPPGPYYGAPYPYPYPYPYYYGAYPYYYGPSVSFGFGGRFGGFRGGFRGHR